MHIALSLGDIARQAGIDTHTPTPSYSHSHSGCVTHAFMHNSMQVNINTYTHMLTHTWHHTAIISPGFKLALKQHAEKRNPNRKIRIEKKSNAPPPQLSEKEWKKLASTLPYKTVYRDTGTAYLIENVYFGYILFEDTTQQIHDFRSYWFRIQWMEKVKWSAFSSTTNACPEKNRDADSVCTSKSFEVWNKLPLKVMNLILSLS